jgi:hypothetical protein
LALQENKNALIYCKYYKKLYPQQAEHL